MKVNYSMPIERKLAAIMFTDIAGYTALSAKDENKALNLLDTQKQILTPIIKEFNGTLHKEMGDGLLFTFPTVSEAVKCGIKIQTQIKDSDDLNLRIGIHEGEVTLKDGDVLGDDVNVASRIEPYAPIGGISISGKVQQNISSLPIYQVKLLGQPVLKGVNQEVKIFCLTSHGLPVADKISTKIDKNSYSTRSIILISTLFGILFFTNIYPIVKNLFNSGTSISSASLVQEQSLFINIDYPKNILSKMEELKLFLNKNDIENNLEALLIAEELIIDDSTKADFYSYMGQVYFQRYELKDKKSSKLLNESKQKFNKSIKLSNLTREPAVIAYYHLASIYLIESDLTKGYYMIKKAMQTDKIYPGVKAKLKEINRQRLKSMES